MFLSLNISYQNKSLQNIDTVILMYLLDCKYSLGYGSYIKLIVSGKHLLGYGPLWLSTPSNELDSVNLSFGCGKDTA